MRTNVFNELNFNVGKEIYYEVLENQDKGFGFDITLKIKYLTKLQIEVLKFLVNCQKKNLLGNIFFKFHTEAIGDMNVLDRTAEKIEKTKDAFKISNSY